VNLLVKSISVERLGHPCSFLVKLKSQKV